MTLSDYVSVLRYLSARSESMPLKLSVLQSEDGLPCSFDEFTKIVKHLGQLNYINLGQGLPNSKLKRENAAALIPHLKPGRISIFAVEARGVELLLEESGKSSSAGKHVKSALSSLSSALLSVGIDLAKDLISSRLPL